MPKLKEIIFDENQPKGKKKQYKLTLIFQNGVKRGMTGNLALRTFKKYMNGQLPKEVRRNGRNNSTVNN